MASKANMRANERLRDAERRAARKINRLKRKGIRTGSIDPRGPVDSSDTRAVNAQVKKLEKFISRDTRYVAGYDGAPLPYDKVRKLREVERRWNKENEKRWRAVARKPYMTGSPATMTVAQQREIGDLEGRLSDMRRKTNVEYVRTAKELDRRIAQMKRQMTKKYRDKRTRQLRENMVEAAKRIGDVDLEREIGNLSNSEVEELYQRSDFVEMLFFRYENMEPYMDDVKIEATESLVDTTQVKAEIEAIKEQRRAQRRKRRRKASKKRKRKMKR